MGRDLHTATAAIVVNEWMESLPFDCRDALQRLHQGLEGIGDSALRTAIDEHLYDAQAALAANEFLDISSAHEAAKLARRVVDHLERLSGSAREIGLLAVAYFVSTDDAEDDFSSPVGFDDDLQVLRSACQHLGIAID